MFGREDVAFEFESFRCRCLIRVGNIRLEFSREVWTRDTDLKFISILVITKAKEVNHLSQGEHTKQEEKTEGRTLGKVNKSQGRIVSRKQREDKVLAWRDC